jgi:hypothetical protein
VFEDRNGVRDAMSQNEELSRSYFELFRAEMRIAAPLWTVSVASTSSA